MNLTESVKLRDSYQCRLCNSLKALEVHHIYGKKRFPVIKDEMSNLITLCHKCHDKFHRFCPKGINTGQDFLEFLGSLYQEKGHSQARGLQMKMKDVIKKIEKKLQSANPINIDKQPIKDELIRKMQGLAQMNIDKWESKFQIEFSVNYNKRKIGYFSDELSFQELKKAQSLFQEFLNTCD